MTKDERLDARQRFEKATELPLLVLAILMVPLLVVPLIVTLPEQVDATFIAIDWFIWAAFAVQFAVRCWLTPERRGRFALHEWPDVLIIVVPFLRPLRIMRSARALRLLSLTRLIGFLGEIGQQSRQLLTRHKLHYVTLVTLGVIVSCAALVLHAEEGNGSSINNFGIAMWWAISTVTTVGYGDVYPTTAAGRGIAAFLMILGIAFFGVLTANVAAFFLERSQREIEAEVETTEQKLDRVLERLTELEELLVRQASR